MEKGKKGSSSYVGYALICIMLGSILISVGHFIKHDLKKIDTELIDVTSVVSGYENTDNDKVNVICKYGYDNNEYNYVCHTAKKEDAMSLYKIGSEKTIKINKSNPGRITILDLSYVILAIYTIGLIFLIIAILYMINEIMRLIKRNKIFKEGLNEGNN